MCARTTLLSVCVSFCGQTRWWGLCMYMHAGPSPDASLEYMFSLAVAQTCQQEQQQPHPSH